MYLNLSEYKQTPKQHSLGVIFLFYRRGNPYKIDVLLIMENLTDSIIAGAYIINILFFK